jgi:hypothetical protein
LSLYFLSVKYFFHSLPQFPAKLKRLFNKVFRRKQKEFFKKFKKAINCSFETLISCRGLININTPFTDGEGVKARAGISKTILVSAKKLIKTDRAEYLEAYLLGADTHFCPTSF